MVDYSKFDNIHDSDDDKEEEMNHHQDLLRRSTPSQGTSGFETKILYLFET
jgi:hypothetical protein